jgi:hypothetical protein
MGPRLRGDDYGDVFALSHLALGLGGVFRVDLASDRSARRSRRPGFSMERPTEIVTRPRISPVNFFFNSFAITAQRM